MSVDTYRYLFSALIQVFGALVAVDAIFLIVWYQLCQTRFENMSLELGRLIAMLSRNRRLLSPIADRIELEILSFDSGARLFLALGMDERIRKVDALREDLDQWIASAEEKVNGSSEGRKHLEQKELDRLQTARKEFAFQRETWDGCRGKLGKIRSLIPKTMGLPAGTSVVFSVALLMTDALAPNGLLTVAVFAVVLSVLVFVKLVWWAESCFE